jgi:hypothetical protein
MTRCGLAAKKDDAAQQSKQWGRCASKTGTLAMLEETLKRSLFVGDHCNPRLEGALVHS